MWVEVTADQDQLLSRTAELINGPDPRSLLLTPKQAIAANRSAISQGIVKIFYYLGAGFELAAKMTHQPKEERYTVCYGLSGQVLPQDGLDLIIDVTLQFIQDQGLQFIYGCRPKRLTSPVLEQIYDLAATDPRVDEKLLLDLPDMWVYRLAYVVVP